MNFLPTLQANEAVNKLYIHNLGEGNFSEMEKIPFPKGLSHQDKSVVYVALKVGNAIVLSSDKLVRSFAPWWIILEKWNKEIGYWFS